MLIVIQKFYVTVEDYFNQKMIRIQVVINALKSNQVENGIDVFNGVLNKVIKKYRRFSHNMKRRLWSMEMFYPL